MKLIPNAILVGFAIGAASIAGCSTDSTNTPNSPAGTRGAASNSCDQNGTVGLQLQLAPGITLSTVQYVITNPTLAGFTTINGSVDVSGSTVIGFSLTLPVAGGYTLSLSAVDSNGDGCSGGPVTFSVAGGTSNTVALSLICSQTVDGGTTAPDVNVGVVSVTADASLQTTVTHGTCAAVASLLATPNEVNVGNAISLTASGIDSNNQSSDVTLTWAATGGAGALTSTTGTSNTFNCTTSGTEMVTVTAAISDGGVSCAGIGSLSVTLKCDAVLDASAPDTGVDTGAPDTGAPDTGTPDTGTPDTGAPDTGTPDTGSPDTGVDTGTADAGPLVPCTTAGQTNCVQCQGNASGTGNNGGLCSPTEAVLVNLDIAQGTQTAAGPAVSASCYSCAYNAGCIDDTQFPDTGHECGDLPSGNFTAGNGNVASFTSDCIALLSCITTSGCAQTNGGVDNCYCGAGGGSPSACPSNGAATNGACKTQEVNGFTFMPSDSTNILKNFSDKAEPSGVANQIIVCANSNGCTQCLR